MAITTKQVAAIARLARLELDEDKQALFAGQFAQILEHMDTLNHVDTSSVEPLYSPVQHTLAYRSDEARAQRTRQQILSGAPQEDGEFFIVPRIV